MTDLPNQLSLLVPRDGTDTAARLVDTAAQVGATAAQGITLTGDPLMDILGSLGAGGLAVYTLSKLLLGWSARKDKEQDIAAAESRAEADAARAEYRTRTQESLDRHSKAFEDLFDLNRHSFSELQKTQQETVRVLSSLAQKIETSMAGSEDNLSMTGARNHFGIWAGKLHYEIYLWYQNRIRENHILEEPDVIGRKYADMLGSVLQRWRYQLEAYRNKGETMMGWDPELVGLTRVYRKLFARLYQDQVAMAAGRNPYFKDPLVELDHLQSRIMGSVVRWASARKQFNTDIDDEENSQLESMGIEFLQDPIP